MSSLRELVEQDLSITLEGDFASVDALGVGLITLVDPDGTSYTGMKGRIDYDYVRETLEGQQVVVNEPRLILRLSSLIRIPQAGERWVVKMPVNPVAGSPIVTWVMHHTHAPELLQTIGVLKLYVQRAVQS